MLDLDCPALLSPEILSYTIRRHMLPVNPPHQKQQPQSPVNARHQKQQQSMFDVLLANSQPHYYDLWALRSDQLQLEYDCMQDMGTISQYGACSDYTISIHPEALPLLKSSNPLLMAWRSTLGQA